MNNDYDDLDGQPWVFDLDIAIGVVCVVGLVLVLSWGL